MTKTLSNNVRHFLHPSRQGLRRSLVSTESLEARCLLASDLIAQWVADDLNATLADGAVITQWNDAVGNIAAVASGNPTLAKDRFDGHSTVRFETSDQIDILRVAALDSPMSDADAFTIALVFGTDDTETQGNSEFWFESTGIVDSSNFGFQNEWGIVINEVGQVGVGMGNPTVSKFSSQAYNDGQAHVVIVSRFADAVSVFVDGQPDTLSGAGTGPRATLDMTFGALASGRNPFDGEIAEVQFYDGFFFANEVRSLTNELLIKYSNIVPNAIDDTYAPTEDALFSVNTHDGVLANDTDADMDALSAVLVDPPQHGTVTLAANGSFTYLSEVNFFGTDSFTYTANDLGVSEPATVTLEVAPSYDPGQAVADYYVVDAGRVYNVDASAGVINNDSNIDGLPLRTALVQDVSDGKIDFQADGSFSYNPEGFTGVAAFSYRLNDSVGDQNTVMVNLLVDHAPVGVVDEYVVDEDGMLTIAAAAGVLRNDSDVEDDELTVVIVQFPSNGSLALDSDGSFVYQPDDDFFGEDSFIYNANDGDQNSDDTIVTVVVQPVNDPPVTTSERYFVFPGDTLVVSAEDGVFANDLDIDSADLSAMAVTNPDNGRLTLNSDGSLTYNPTAGFSGIDSFSYRANDGDDVSAETFVELRVQQEQIVISEVLSANQDGQRDYFGRSSDWIELLNDDDRTVDLKGWYVTDSPEELTKWRIPVQRVLEPGERLVIYASGRDTISANGQLHSNFRLSTNGEYLAAVRPNESIAWEIPGTIPEQFTDVSYGTSDLEITTQLVSQGSTARLLVPKDGSLDGLWQAEQFDDSDWQTGEVAFGFAIEEPTKVVPGFRVRMVTSVGGTDGAVSTSYEAESILLNEFSEGRHEIGIDIGTNLPSINFGSSEGTFAGAEPLLNGVADHTQDSFVLQVNATVTIPEGEWMIGFGSDDGGFLRLADVAFAKTFGERGLSSDDGELVYKNLRNHNWTWGAFEVGPDGMTTSLEGISFDLRGTESFEIGISPGRSDRLPTSNEWTLLTDGALGWQVESTVAAPPPDFSRLIETDVEAGVFEQGTGAFVRIPFHVEDASIFESLRLEMQYNDGFVAYINGAEVARANVANDPVWDTLADTERHLLDGLSPEIFMLDQYLSLLHNGENILAIHGINSSIDSPGFLVMPTLEALDVFSRTLNYMETPTLGQPNDVGKLGVLSPPRVSIPSGTFMTDSISVELESGMPEAVIRYTVDGKLPTSGSPIYSEPITIDKSSQIRAQAFLLDYVTSRVNTEKYSKLATDLADFSSDLPILVIDTFDMRVTGKDFTSSHSFVFEPGEDGRSQLIDVPDVSTRSGVKVRGSSSAGFQKSPLAHEFRRDDSDGDQDYPIGGMPADSDWVLQGPWEFDRSLTRNPLIFDLSNQVGVYASRTRYVEVFYDRDGGELSMDDYFGVYIVIEKISRAEHRVSVEEVTAAMTTEPDITGGYILKIDRQDPGDAGFVAGGHRLNYVNPKEVDIELRAEQVAYLKQYIDEFDAALDAEHFTHPELGKHYGEYIDIQSWVDHHLINEIMLNVDALRLSAYHHKPRGGKMIAGPVWDYDRSAESNDGRDDNPRRWYQDIESVPSWWDRIFADLEFRQMYIDRWQEWREGAWSMDNISATLDHLADQLREAQVRNFERWANRPPRFPRHVNFKSGKLDGTWEGEIEHKREWLRQRVEWLDSVFLRKPIADVASGTYDNPVSVSFDLPGNTTAYYTTDGTDPRLAGGGISPTAVEYTGPFIVSADTLITARSYDPTFNVPITDFNKLENDEEAWSGPAITELQFGVLADVTNVRVSEIHFNPGDPSPAEIDAGFDNNDEFEFVEVVNISDTTLDISNVQFVLANVGGDTEGIEFDFAQGDIQTLRPGQRAIVAENLDAFVARYGDGLTVAGQWAGGLSNNSETLTLMAGDTVVQQFAYNDDWYGSTDGGGFSLESIDVNEPNLAVWSQPAGWQPSSQVGGTPGRGAGDPSGDFNADGTIAFDDIDLLGVEVRVGTSRPKFDLNMDSVVDAMDIKYLVENVLQTRLGDANLDGGVGFEDFVSLSTNFSKAASSWADGDFNGDGQVTFADFNTLSNNFGFRAEAAPTTSGPKADVVDEVYKAI